jgi:membrane fusion protein, multidrug efflux system
MKVPAAVILLSIIVHGVGVSRAAPFETALVEPEAGEQQYVADGYVEAVRQSVIASQVPGRITGITVKAGDLVKSGQPLARIDERAAVLQAAVSQAQVAVAQAQLEAARKEYERSQRLYKKEYISQAAMEQAEAQYKSTQAQARAMLAQAGVAGTETSLHTLRAPYDGVLSELNAEVGDMATPGKALMTVYDPGVLRVVANVPESYANSIKKSAPVRLELPGAPAPLRWQVAQAVLVLPTVDPSSHTVQVRLALPPKLAGLTPGTFAKAYLPTSAPRGAGLSIPAKAIIKRTELSAVYVVDANGRPQLRQVRLGNAVGDRVEVLAGLQAGERIALDPLAAARQ